MPPMPLIRLLEGWRVEIKSAVSLEMHADAQLSTNKTLESVSNLLILLL
jgi:hypothetical protein